MPRTKRSNVKKPERLVEGGDTKGEVLKKFDKMVADAKKSIDVRAQMEARNIELAFKMLLGTINKRYLSMTVGQLKNELYIEETTNTRVSRQIGRSASHDDGYLTENSSQDSGDKARKIMGPPSSGRAASRRSRSADASRAASRTAQRRRSKSVYRTPAYNKNATTAYPVITPKVAPHTPLTVARQPRAGELVVSMTGSPVIVNTYNNLQRDEKANCNIMLADGTLLTVAPTQLRHSQAYIPLALMDDSVLAQLRTLKDNLDKVVRLGEKKTHS